MTEAGLQARVEAECSRRGLLWHHCRDCRSCRGPRGFPDLVVAGRRGLVFAELKTETGDTSAAQDIWLWTLGRGTHSGPDEACEPYQVQLWRPSHLEAGRIARSLDSIR